MEMTLAVKVQAPDWMTPDLFCDLVWLAFNPTLRSQIEYLTEVSDIARLRSREGDKTTIITVHLVR